VSERVLVTGATGFVGGELVRLLLERGFEVHALARGAHPTLPVAWHAGDLIDARAVDAAIAAARPRWVVHCGALISYASRDTARAAEVNVEGTRHVLEACKRQRVARLVFVSSVVAVGPSPDGRPLDERSAFHGAKFGVDYMDTKRAAEELVLAASGELDVVVANPAAVYGPAEGRSNTVKFLQQLAAGKRPMAAPPGTIALVGVRDTAEGILLVLERGRRGERYLLVERCVPVIELFRMMSEALGVPPVRRTVPRALWPLVVALARVLDRLRPLEIATPQGLAMIGSRLVFDARKAREELGWRPRPFEEVLAQTISILRERGVLPPRDGARSPG